MSYVILRGCWCDIIVLNVHDPTDDKTDVTKDSLSEELERVFDQFPNYHMQLLLEDFNPKAARKDIFKATVGNESLHGISDYGGVRVVNFATSKNLIVKRTMFPLRNIHKFTWTSDGKTRNQIDDIRDGIQVHLMSDLSGEQAVVQITIWWWQI
jgi:hypothetical protein